MKYYIEDAQGCKTKNGKGVELYRYCADNYRHVILDSEDEIDNIINDIQDKISKLDRKYPRSRQSLKANYRKFKYADFGTISVDWEDNNHNACCTMKVVVAKGILADGVMQDND